MCTDTKITVDVVIIKDNQVLLIQRDKSPFENYRALPGGCILENETSMCAAKRILEQETSLRVPALNLIGIYDNPKRDPRGRYLSLAYGWVISSNKLTLNSKLNPEFYPINALPQDMAFDHGRIIEDMVSKLSIGTFK